MANGIKLASQEVFGDFTSNGLRFTFRAGGLQSMAEFVGEDDEIMGASGLDPGEWTAATRELKLHGLVSATSGSTAQALRESFKTNFALLLAVMDTATLVTVTVYPPHFGLTAGTTATMTSCRPMRLVGPDPAEVAWYEAWEGEVHLTAIKSPPNWTVA